MNPYWAKFNPETRKVTFKAGNDETKSYFNASARESPFKFVIETLTGDEAPRFCEGIYSSDELSDKAIEHLSAVILASKNSGLRPYFATPYGVIKAADIIVAEAVADGALKPRFVPDGEVTPESIIDEISANLVWNGMRADSMALGQAFIIIQIQPDRLAKAKEMNEDVRLFNACLDGYMVRGDTLEQVIVKTAQFLFDEYNKLQAKLAYARNFPVSKKDER